MDEVSAIGGKAASLRWLSAHGFSVPRFEVIAAAEISPLLPSDERFQRHLGHLAVAADDFFLDALCGAISTRLDGISALEPLNSLVLQAAAHLQSAEVAVRSSAAGEDSATTSAAGQYTTTFVPKQPRDLLAAVDIVIKSFFNVRAVMYRRARGQPEAMYNLSVILQEFRAPVVAGVAFSQHPVTRANTVVINAAPGLGTRVVDGTVTPDHYEVERSDMSLTHIRLSARVGDDDLARLSAVRQLFLPMVPELCRLVDSAARMRGCELDIEWAVLDSPKGLEIVLLQARPITAAAAYVPHIQMRRQELY